MPRRAQLALVAYSVLVGSVFTPLYEPLTTGRDDSWAIAVVIGAAHIGLGAAVARAWVLLLPILFGVVAFFVDGAEGLSVLILVFGIPIGLIATALGWGGGGRGASPPCSCAHAHGIRVRADPGQLGGY